MGGTLFYGEGGGDGDVGVEAAGGFVPYDVLVEAGTNRAGTGEVDDVSAARE